MPKQMAFGVFIHRSDSIYDDSPAVQYQFPQQYLGRASKSEGDWIVYYEPRKAAGSRGYFAVARVAKITPDPTAAGMYLALIEPGSYLDFANPVPFSGDKGLIERGLLNEAGKISGRAQSAVRPLSSEDFSRIIAAGLGDDDAILPRIDIVQDDPGFGDEAAPFVFDQRVRSTFTVSRVVRDRVFRQVILRAYDSRCAVTGLKLINGGGRAEVEAAHIQPVEKNGPDVVNNGIALSGTVHWMFDRGLISFADDMRVLVSRHVNDPDSINGIIQKSGLANTPARYSDRPHPQFLRWHRENCFKH